MPGSSSILDEPYCVVLGCRGTYLEDGAWQMVMLLVILSRVTPQDPYVMPGGKQLAANSS